MKQWKDITPRKLTDDYEIKPPAPKRVGYPKPQKPDSMFKSIWKTVKKVVTKTVLPIVSNEIALDELLPYIKKHIDISLRVYDKDSDGNTDILVSVLFKGNVIYSITRKI